MDASTGKLTVMMATEGTYPYAQGGVSTWCDTLVNRLPDIDFVIYSVVVDPHIAMNYRLPSHARMQTVPLWGTEEPSEHLQIAFSKVYMAKLRTRPSVIDKRFIPLFTELMTEILRVDKNPIALGQTLYELHQYFKRYEYKVSFRSELTWNAYKSIVERCVEDPSQRLAQADVFGLIQSLGWVYRFLTVLNTPVPFAHVSHSSAAAFCSIPCVLAKIERGTPFLLTEHGVYLREQYLSLAKRGYSPFLTTFLVRLIHSVTTLNYAYADQVSPVCAYNTRWEARLGVSPNLTQVIYNGVDTARFTECDYGSQERPTVVTVARIDPIKDIKLLIRSADQVRNQIPDVRYIVYGSVSVREYYDECLKLCEELGLQETVEFAGHSDSMSAAYQSGDVIALTSISEAFPYSVVEAMMTGKAVIATDVGGIREALGKTGVLITPGDCEELTRATVSMLQNPALRTTLGQEARERALENFTLQKVLEEHLKSYLKLTVSATVAKENDVQEEQYNTDQEKLRKPIFVPGNRQRSGKDVYPQNGLLLQQECLERGLALSELRWHEAAIGQFQEALLINPSSPATPAILLAIASAYLELEQFDLVQLQLYKYNAFIGLQFFQLSA